MCPAACLAAVQRQASQPTSTLISLNNSIFGSLRIGLLDRYIGTRLYPPHPRPPAGKRPRARVRTLAGWDPFGISTTPYGPDLSSTPAPNSLLPCSRTTDSPAVGAEVFPAGIVLHMERLTPYPWLHVQFFIKNMRHVGGLLSAPHHAARQFQTPPTHTPTPRLAAPLLGYVPTAPSSAPRTPYCLAHSATRSRHELYGLRGVVAGHGSTAGVGRGQIVEWVCGVVAARNALAAREPRAQSRPARCKFCRKRGPDHAACVVARRNYIMYTARAIGDARGVGIALSDLTGTGPHRYAATHLDCRCSGGEACAC